MYKTFHDVKNIKFPVYPLPSRDWFRQDGVLFLGTKVLDDSNMPGETIGVRRLQCGRSDLLKLKKACPDFASMLNSGSNTFVDSAGKPFIYRRTIHSDLKHYLVKELIPKDTFTVVKLRGVTAPFIIPRPPVCEPIYAKVLHFRKDPWIIYGFSEQKGTDSFRRV